MDGGRSSVAVILASAGRPELLGAVIDDLLAQTIEFTLVLSVPDDASLPSAPGLTSPAVPDRARVVYARGLTAQRNAGLDVVPDAEFVFFFDDDAVVRADYLEHAVQFFRSRPDVVGMTGRVLLDGATGAEIPRAVADAAIARSTAESSGRQVSQTEELYGCNFGFRQAAAGGERFDPRLPLYSWLEDHDFARRLMRHGALAKVSDCVIVHMGTKSGGRTAHERLGYSQMMNPAYLRHVGSFPLTLAARETMFRVGKNVLRSFAGPERRWRRERLRGNALALTDILRRRFTPERILDIPVSRRP